MSQLHLNKGKQVIEVESKNLIQKAHELYNVRSSASANSGRRSIDTETPEKKNVGLSIAERAARMHCGNDLPEIEEMADKENDTFAQGGPMKALALLRNASQKKMEQRTKERSQLRSADVSNDKKYRMYREPGDRDSEGIGKLARG